MAISDFYISMYEVTQAEYAEVMGSNSSSFSGDTLPVETVSWLDAIRYCNARRSGMGIRLPRWNNDIIQHRNVHQRRGSKWQQSV